MFGSCIARDVIEVGLKKGVLTTPNCFARSSMASLSSPPLIDELLLARIESLYQQHIVRADMDKSFLQALAQEDFDILLIDLAEERFPLLETAKGQLLTLSEEYMAHTDQNSARGLVIEPGSSRYYEKWHQGWYEVESLLKKRNLLSKVRVLEFFLANKIDNGALFSQNPNPFGLQNDLLSSHYEFLRKVLPEKCFVSFSSELLIADHNHKWGLSPMHYIPDMYNYALKEICV